MDRGRAQQSVTGLDDQPEEPDAFADDPLVADELVVEEVSIDGMCGVY
jgi:mycofactocin precursor